MTTIEACHRFAQRTDRSAFPVRAELRGFDIWPLAAAAAVDLAGCLSDAMDDSELDQGLQHFLSLKRCGVVSARQLAMRVTSIKSYLLQAWRG